MRPAQAPLQLSPTSPRRHTAMTLAQISGQFFQPLTTRPRREHARSLMMSRARWRKENRKRRADLPQLQGRRTRSCLRSGTVHQKRTNDEVQWEVIKDQLRGQSENGKAGA
ncbi:uncharacterized protein BO66DRAFT_82809 [Aspergillus aculeatinus CBS 121060]|uniref:Uncharacterized protein n=1 Tax=Aspergillus aculeatinus CBS 121060 TaxID=1448322 RepID=A0ACD1HAJ7_9EURO|nr:hypothetical protein BO66DRAFT_82809 [Aspergillus aculeatinus CBS 121060]RAH70572.1 hypothetical protein BO66DRAFT_82809 [Aspergillus aculeatinus CBS 121060]